MSGTNADARLSLPDAPAKSLVLRLTPEYALPFVQLARFDRPIGWQLLLAPCWQSIALAALAEGKGPNLWHLALTLVGAVTMRGAGCAYNDVLDRDLDAGVERTRGRPLPSGRIGVRAALALVVVLSLVGAAVLLQFSYFTIVLGIASLVIVAIYPLAKRLTSWPQVILGTAFSWGALVGWSATFGSLSTAPVLLYISAVAWTIGYDTIYALQDARDDAIVGIRSTARLFGDYTRVAVAALYALSAGAALWAILRVGGGGIAFLGWAAFAAHLGWQVIRLDDTSPANALKLFRSNRDAGFVLFAGIALAGWF